MKVLNQKRILSLIFFLSFSEAAYADPVTRYKERQAKATPGSVLSFLKNGNERFASGTSIHGGYAGDARERVAVSAPRQRPLAVVLSCIDSRTTPEVIFDTTVGDLFTPRVGGNVISHDILGSLEVSVASGVKLVVVMGHKDCGAVKGACRDVEFEHLTQIINKVKPAIGTTNELLDRNPHLDKKVGARVPENPKYIAQVSHTNAKQSVEQILKRSTYLKSKVETGEIQIRSALYDVNTGRVEFDEPSDISFSRTMAFDSRPHCCSGDPRDCRCKR